MNETICYRKVSWRSGRLFAELLAGILLLSACAPAVIPQPTPNMSTAIAQAAATMLAEATPTPETIPATPAPAETAIPEPTAVRTPPALPEEFSTTLLNPVDTPHTYITDTCQALKDKWDPNNASPGTVVMIIMIHGISKGEPAKPQDMSLADFKKLMNDLNDQGFTAINTQQLFDFLDHNAKIPERSVMLLQDDRHTAQNFNDVFRPYWEKWKWPVVNAWINAGDDTGRIYLPENVALSNEGWVDYQSHGVLHLPIDPSSSEEFIHSELFGSMEAMQKNFNKTPIAYIWAGGGFTPDSVKMARQAGYKLGFTINPRGPLMFNWVPQADAADPMRPAYIPEGSAGDPLMTLPRYWDTDARSHLDVVRNISQAAAANAQENKTTELEYFDIVCAPTYGVLPQP